MFSGHAQAEKKLHSNSIKIVRQNIWHLIQC